MEPKKKDQRDIWLIRFLIVLLLLGLLAVGSTIKFRHGNRIEFDKYWCGNAVNSVHNIVVTMDNGTVVFNDGLPSGHEVVIKYVYVGQTATVAWDDVNGHHSESVGPINCDDGVYAITNTVNYGYPVSLKFPCLKTVSIWRN